MATAHSPIKRLGWPFFAILGSTFVLQLVSFFLVRYVDDIEERHNATLGVTERLGILVEQYERCSYLAVAGIATKNWELLLEQRRTVQELSMEFQRTVLALDSGGVVSTGAQMVQVTRLGDTAQRSMLASALELWHEVVRAHVRVLRSNNRELKHNPDLNGFHETIRTLAALLHTLNAQVQERLGKERDWFQKLESLIPFASMLMLSFLGVIVFRSLLVPLGKAVRNLEESQAELRKMRDRLEERVIERTAELAEANRELKQARHLLEERVAERTAELEEAQRQLIESALAAGKAEVAVEVLHNVGNGLNRVKVTAHILREQVMHKRWDGMDKLAGVLKEHEADLAAYLTQDEKGKRLAVFIIQLFHNLTRKRAQLVDEVERLVGHIDYINDIIKLQQAHVRSVSLVEETTLEEIVEDALRVSREALERHSISVVCNYMSIPSVRLNRYRVLQILINLISNAKHALDETPRKERRLGIRVFMRDEARACIEVTDNGHGIAAELLTRIFQQGFTTRGAGHGFSLHSSVLAAMQMGGLLIAESPGVGQGATFRLELPFDPPSTATDD